jgi:hypothetical protein
MQASQQMRRGVHPLAVLAALLAAVLLSGAAGYLVRGGLPQSQSQAPAAATDTVPSWAQQGMGPTDSDAYQSTGVNVPHEQPGGAMDPSIVPAPPVAASCPSQDIVGPTC